MGRTKVAGRTKVRSLGRAARLRDGLRQQGMSPGGRVAGSVAGWLSPMKEDAADVWPEFLGNVVQGGGFYLRSPID